MRILGICLITLMLTSVVFAQSPDEIEFPFKDLNDPRVVDTSYIFVQGTDQNSAVWYFVIWYHDQEEGLTFDLFALTLTKYDLEKTFFWGMTVNYKGETYTSGQIILDVDVTSKDWVIGHLNGYGKKFLRAEIPPVE